MLITALLGSPRKDGSTARIVEEILRGARENGAQTQMYCLNELTIRGCQCCNACIHKPDVACATQDDANEILQAISQSDGVVFGTPVYMSTMTGQMKTMVDRLYPFLKNDNTSKMQPGKKALWAVTQRQPDETRYLPVFEKLKFPMGFIGFTDCRIFIAAGTLTPEHLLNQPETMVKAHNLGAWLVEPVTR